MPKPEEVPKKPKSRGEYLAKTCGDTKKNPKKVSEVLGLEVSRILFFLQVLTIFSLKTLPEPEEVPKKPKSRGEHLAKT